MFSYLMRVTKLRTSQNCEDKYITCWMTSPSHVLSSQLSAKIYMCNFHDMTNVKTVTCRRRRYSMSRENSREASIVICSLCIMCLFGIFLDSHKQFSSVSSRSSMYVACIFMFKFTTTHSHEVSRRLIACE